MADLKAPVISVSFSEAGSTALSRGEKGCVAIIVRDDAETQPMTMTLEAQIPTTLSKENQAYIQRAFLGNDTPPTQVIVYALPTEGDISDALAWMATQEFDYLVGPPSCTTAEADSIAAWVKAQRRDGCVKYKAVLPNCAADDCAIINFASDGMTDGESTWSAAEYCSRIAGLLAGTAAKHSATYAALPELSDVARLSNAELDAAVGAGKLVLKWDGRKVKVCRAVTSLTTLGEGVQGSFRKIKIVEIMDLINTDVVRLVEDGYIGKYVNDYDNRLILLTAIRSYFQGLERDELVSEGWTAELDAAAQAEYLSTEMGEDISGMSETDILKADTGSHVFILVKCRILDSIEDVVIAVNI